MPLETILLILLPVCLLLGFSMGFAFGVKWIGAKLLAEDKKKTRQISDDMPEHFTEKKKKDKKEKKEKKEKKIRRVIETV